MHSKNCVKSLNNIPFKSTNFFLIFFLTFVNSIMRIFACYDYSITYNAFFFLYSWKNLAHVTELKAFLR